MFSPPLFHTTSFDMPVSLAADFFYFFFFVSLFLPCVCQHHLSSLKSVFSFDMLISNLLNAVIITQ